MCVNYWPFCSAISTMRTDCMQSLAWAHSIVPQSCGFLRLPFEVRRTIYDLVIEEFSYGWEAIQPLKKGKKFYSPTWSDAAMETTALYQLCRQSYVDVVGSGLLYRARPFWFKSPTLMLNYLVSMIDFLTFFAPLILEFSSYNHVLSREPRVAWHFNSPLKHFRIDKLTPQLWVINPVHKDAICSIKLRFNIRNDSKTLPSKALEFLAECRGLHHLTLEMDVDSAVCTPSWVPTAPGTFGRTFYYEVPDTILAKVEEWKALKGIKGLLSFAFHVIVTRKVYRPYYYGSWTTRTEALTKPSSEERYLQLEDNLRRAILTK